ncbi:MarR family winged helix-turn-helix transcriptional regulator [Nesterenkonia aerolata]|uniref:MarR family transcriptional regulator n=1 Tax=Nesterenkonia aerolata TaxID=3074079 RepID=A0ABU2DQP9_9MICC|nr:MarR family transcriptional regulator [Nesterenkonia sp. LY-0111]MDR8018832.1 MarR family transcriptional regulator [Nesterenkonia sp. LY-0111]
MHMQVDTSGASHASDISITWAKVAAFASAMDASLDKWLGNTYRVGLTEFRALSFVSQTSEKELRVNHLAQKVGLNQTSATRLVTRLETKGYAQRDVCEDDGRGVYAVITEAGEDLLREAKGPYAARVRELLENSSTHFPHLDAGHLSYALHEIESLLTT